jgi:acetylornithine deacetylase/succinyl-diaminopimelate desuccinylase-like protein
VFLLGRLVEARSPNPPGDERAVAKVIREEAQLLGLPEPDVYALDPLRPNLIFRLGSGSPSLILAAHMDTVPPGEIGLWGSDPFELTEVEGRLVGLGAADMKASIAAMLVASARWLRSPSPLGSVTLVFSADEENFSQFGMEFLANEGLLVGDGAVVTEPSSVGTGSWDSFFVAQRGSCVAWLTAHGEPGHSGALIPSHRRAAAPFAKALTALVEADLFTEWRHPIDGTPVTVNIGTVVKGGVIAIAHPEFLQAAIEVRTLEGMTEELVLGELRNVIEAAGLGARVEIHPASAPANWFDPGWEARDERLLAAARAAWTETLDRPPPTPAVMTAGTDSTHLNAVGIAALPAFGPGTLALAHKPNESIEANDLLLAIDLFNALIRAYTSR